MSRITNIGIFVLFLLTVQCDQRKRHHRRSISYDDRWFGFHFDNEPISSTFHGKHTLIPCTYSLVRKRESVVEWRRDSTPINVSDKRISILSNGSLLLNDTSRSDEGVYQCVVHITDDDGSTWTFLSNKAVMRVKSTLRWKEEPKDTTIQEGKRGILRCELDEKDKSTIRWIKDEKEINESNHLLKNGYTGIMEIGGMRKEDEGVYSCIATRDNERIESARARISMKKGNEPIDLNFLSRPISRRMKEGEETLLECFPSGEREFRVEWTKDGRKIDDLKGIQRMGSSLYISSLQFDHSGIFTCRVNDSTDSIEASATLTLIAPPHITSRPQDIVAVETTDVEMECYSSGRPSPILSWFKNGEMLVPSEYFVIESNKLRILGVVKTDQGIYECFVENEGGTAHAAVQLLVDNTGISVPSRVAKKEVSRDELIVNTGQSYSDDSSLIAAHSGTPVKVSAPLGLGITVIGSREATLIWDPPIQKNGNILHYHLYYKEEGSDRERVVNSTDRFGRLRDLHPSTSYLIRVAAENEAGIGDISNPITLTTKEEQEVPGRVVNLSAIGIGSETIEVEWRKPSNGGAIPLFYRLFYVRSDRKLMEKETQINVPSTAYTMHGMDKYTSYDIRVEAEGEKGAGLSSNTVTVRTLSDVPSMAPIDITARSISTTSIKVTWKVDESQSNGPITGARMKMKTKARGSKASNIVMDSSRLEEIVEGLEAGTAYQLRIALVNQNGTGPYSDWISVDTPLTEKDESVLGAPRELTARATSDSISLTWIPPADESVLVRGYQIGWGLNIPDVDSSRVDGDIHEFKINGLKPSRDYVISVRAWNRQGSGFPIYETVRTSSTGGSMIGGEGIDGKGNEISVLDSPLGVHSTALSATSIRLDWADNPSLFNIVYNVKYMSKIDSGHARFLNTSESWIVVDKLKPGTEYELAVRAMVPPSSLSPWSMTVTQVTLPAAPSSSPRDVTVLPAASGDPHSVTVNWQPPKYANGELTEYIVYYTDRGSARDEEWISIRVAADRLSVPIDNLLPKATYYFRIQAKNEKGMGPMSPNQSYSPGSVGFVHPTGKSVKTKKGPIQDILSSINDVALWPIVIIVLIVLLILILCLVCVCIVKKFSTKSSPNGYGGGGGGRKASNGKNRNNDLWIQHGVGGASSHLLTETPSINDIKNGRNGVSTPPRYHNGTINRGEDTYACVIGGRRVPSLPFDNESSIDSTRPLLSSRITHKSHPHMVQVAPPAPGSSTGDSERSGTLSRSYQHSTTSLDQRQRTPHMVYGGHGRGMGKIDIGESPYGSWMGLPSGTPPPPNLAPPQPPIVTADGYRSIRDASNIANMPSGGLRSFSNINGGLSTVRQIPVGRAQAQPRVNVANLCSPYVSSSAMSVEDEKMGYKEDEMSNPSHLTLHQSISTEELDEMGDVDIMITDLQALQQEFGVNP